MAMIDVVQLKQQLRKDWMRSYWMFGSFAATAIGGVVLSANAFSTAPVRCVPSCNSNIGDSLEFGLRAVLTLLVFLTTVALIQDDGPIDENAFWRSQPLSTRSLLLSKALLTFVYLLGITVIAQIAVLKVNALSVMGSSLVVLTTVYWFASAIFISILIAAFTRSTQSAILFGLGLLVVRLLFSFSLLERTLLIPVAIAKAGPLRGDLWVLLALTVIIWIYAAKSVRARTRHVVAGISTVALVGFWDPAVNTPIAKLTQPFENENKSLPLVTVSARLLKNPSGRVQSLTLQLATAEPRIGYRYRFSSYVVNAQAASAPQKSVMVGTDPWGPTFAKQVAQANTFPQQESNIVTATLFLSDLPILRDSTTILTVNGLLIEEKLVEVGSMPLREGRTLQYDASLFTILTVAEDMGLPQIAYDAISGGGHRQFVQPFVDSRVTVFSGGYNELRESSPQTYVRFHNGLDTLKLVNFREMRCNTILPFPSVSVKRTCGSLRAERDSVRVSRGSSDWLHDSQLFWQQWRHVSFKRVQIETPLSQIY